MSGEDPEDKKVENPAADDDSIDDESLDDVFEVDETLTLTVILRLIGRLQKLSLRWLKHQMSQLRNTRSTVNCRCHTVGFDTLGR